MRRGECGEYAELLLRQAAGELDSEGRARLARHVENCEACSQAGAGQAVVWQALDEWAPPPIAADFDRRLYRRIEGEIGWWDRLRLSFRGTLLRRGIPVAAAAGLALMAGLIMQRPGTVQPAPERAVLADPIRPDQVDRAVEDMELLQQFDGLVLADSTESRM